MKTNATLLSTLLIATVATLAGCKKTEYTAPAEAVVAPVAGAPAAPAASAPATPVAAAPGAGTPAPAAPASAGTFDINSVPVTTTAPPPFPYLDWPAKLEEGKRNNEEFDFDSVSMVAGTDLRSVEGRVSARHFSLTSAKLSRLAAERNYDNALKAMGAVAVSKLQPDDPEFIKLHPEVSDTYKSKKQFKVLDWGKYTTYLLRTPQTNIWIAVSIDDFNVVIVAVEEKAMEQAVKPLTAAAMQSELEKAGHVALYLNFDTDKAIIRDTDKGTVDQITELLTKNAALKLTVEGHTDTSGDAGRNKVLSEQRAKAVMEPLVGKGVDKARLASTGLGGAKPVADNGSEEGRSKNRRVELVKQG